MIPFAFPLAVVALLAPTHTAIVLSIDDGDTLHVREARHTLNVRLAYIDAPETKLTQGFDRLESLLLLLAESSELQGLPAGSQREPMA